MSIFTFILIFKFLKLALKFFKERICHYQGKKNSDFAMIHGNYLVKVGSYRSFVTRLLNWGFVSIAEGNREHKWNRMVWYDSVFGI